jgi:hypothetical protein
VTYFADLTPYSFIKSVTTNGLNVGWLDNRHPFLRGRVDQSVLGRIFMLCTEHPKNKTRGWHNCPLCLEPEYPYRTEHNGRKIVLGSAEIWIEARSGVQYAAPDLIFHYIRDHQYLPPREFIEAIMEQQW